MTSEHLVALAFGLHALVVASLAGGILAASSGVLAAVVHASSRSCSSECPDRGSRSRSLSSRDVRLGPPIRSRHQRADGAGAGRRCRRRGCGTRRRTSPPAPIRSRERRAGRARPGSTPRGRRRSPATTTPAAPPPAAPASGSRCRRSGTAPRSGARTRRPRSRPPGRVTRRISASAASTSPTFRSPKEMVTASKAPSANGRPGGVARDEARGPGGGARPTRSIPSEKSHGHGEHPGVARTARSTSRSRRPGRAAARPGGRRAPRRRRGASAGPGPATARRSCGRTWRPRRRTSRRPRADACPGSRGACVHASQEPGASDAATASTYAETRCPPSAGAAEPARRWSPGPSRSTDPGPLLALLLRGGRAGLGAPRRGPRRLGQRRDDPTSGADRFADAERGWARADPARRRPRRGRPARHGSGRVRLVRLRRRARPRAACSSCPEVVVGHRGGRWWVTTIGVGALLAPPPAPAPAGSRAGAPGEVTFADGARSGPEWETVVASRDRADRRGRGREGRARPRPRGAAPSSPSTRAGCCAGSPSATRAAGPSASTAWSAPPRRCSCAGRRAW